MGAVIITSPLLQVEDEDAVADAGRVAAARRLERDAPAVGADHGVRCLVARILAPSRDAREVLAVRLELELPDVDVVRVLLRLFAARLDQRVLAVRKDAFDLVVLAGELAERRRLSGRQ